MTTPSTESNNNTATFGMIEVGGTEVAEVSAIISTIINEVYSDLSAVGGCTEREDAGP